MIVSIILGQVIDIIEYAKKKTILSLSSPLDSSRVGRDSVSGDCTSNVVLHHGLHASSPLRWVRMRGDMMEKLMVFWMDLGS